MKPNHTAKLALPIIFIALIIVFFIVLHEKEGFLNEFTSSEPSPVVSPANYGQDPNITVSNPKANQLVGSPINLKGNARVFESVFQYRVKDANNNILKESSEMANAADMGLFGSYDLKVFYNIPSTNNGVLEVFSSSPKDGSEINRVLIPIRFSRETMKINTYFSKTGQAECENVTLVQRTIPKTLETGRAAIESLLEGPSQSETNQGYLTSLNQGTRINSLNIKDGTAYVDFNYILGENMYGSCKVGATRSQITKTLKQFTTISNVVISINGETEQILQP